MKIIVIDNYDSFTYNLVQYIGEVDQTPRVIRNDEWSLKQIREFDPRAVVISPGPGRPEDAGISVPLLREIGEEIPVLGVCLGLQCLAAAFGGKIVAADRLLHGKISTIYHADTPLYRDLPVSFEATRYHSLVVDEDSLPSELSVDAVSERGEIMGLHHHRLPLLAVQFHPESILTRGGKKLMKNFIEYAKNPYPVGKTSPEKIDLSKKEPET